MASIGPYKKRLISEGGTDPTGFARFIVSSREHREPFSSLSIFPRIFFPVMKEERLFQFVLFFLTLSYSQSRNANPASVKSDQFKN